MTSPTSVGSPSEFFQLKRHQEVAVIIPSPEVEDLNEDLIRPAAEIVLAPLRVNPPNSLIVDLSGVRYFATVFIQFLLECHWLAQKHNAEMVIAGANERVQDLLRHTNLSTLWAIYEDREEALKNLGGSN